VSNYFGANLLRLKMNLAKKAVLVPAGNDRFGKPLVFDVGEYFHCKVSAEDTSGDLCVYETIRTKTSGPPLHYHHNQDEWFFVREGEFLFQVGDDRFRLRAGDSIFAPRKVPHAFANVSERGTLMIIYQPAGTIEQFFIDGSKLLLGNPTAKEWRALNRVHGVEIVGPQLKLD
jgi:mannose-6-phosphate isomerase-like protein (cupin superfamily)